MKHWRTSSRKKKMEFLVLCVFPPVIIVSLMLGILTWTFYFNEDCPIWVPSLITGLFIFTVSLFVFFCRLDRKCPCGPDQKHEEQPYGEFMTECRYCGQIFTYMPSCGWPDGS